jgi:hypothetical protein
MENFMKLMNSKISVGECEVHTIKQFQGWYLPL